MTRSSKRPGDFMRNGTTSPFGKLTEQIPAIKIDGDTKDALMRAARDADLPLQEFIRLLLMIRVHGLDMVTRLQADRLRVVSGKNEQR